MSDALSGWPYCPCCEWTDYWEDNACQKCGHPTKCIVGEKGEPHADDPYVPPENPLAAKVADLQARLGALTEAAWYATCDACAKYGPMDGQYAGASEFYHSKMQHGLCLHDALASSPEPTASTEETDE